MTPKHLDAIEVARKIATTAYPLHEIHDDRWLFGFDGQPHLFVVASSRVTLLGLALLIVEQTAVARAMQVASDTHETLAAMTLRDLPTQGGEQ